MIKDESAAQDLNHASIQPHEGGQLQELPAGDNDELNAPPQGGLNLRPLLRTLQRKALLITVITGAVSCGAFLMSKKTLPTYEGKFRILVEPATNEARSSDPSNLARSQGQASRDAFSVDYPTQLEILRSPKMLRSILEQIKTTDPKDTKFKSLLKELNLDPKDPKLKDLNYVELQKSLTIERLGKTELDQTKILEVRYKGADPKIVNLVLKVTSDKFLDYSLAERKSRINEGIKFIDEQAPKLSTKVETLRLDLQKIQQQYRLTDPKAQGTEILTQLRQVEGQQLDTQRMLQEQRTLYANLQKQLDIKNPSEAIAASTLSENHTYQEVLAKLKEVEVQIAVESARFQPESPTIQALQDKRQNLLSLLN